MSYDSGNWLPYNLNGTLHECRGSRKGKGKDKDKTPEMAKDSTSDDNANIGIIRSQTKENRVYIVWRFEMNITNNNNKNNEANSPMMFADRDRATIPATTNPIRLDCESMIDNVQIAFNVVDILNNGYKQQPKIIHELRILIELRISMIRAR